VVFVSPQIHWNTGNIGRTALGLGLRLHLVGPLGFSLDERQVRRAGLDYWHHVDLRVYEDWEEFSRPGGPMETLGGTRYFFTKFGAEAAVDVDYTAGRASADEPVVLLFGSEVDGFTCMENWLERGPGVSERRVAFPMVNEHFRAYNLSTTASMSVWDAYKALTLAARRSASVWTPAASVAGTSE
jgi:tRNA (cytidine/uridine-2'-O-)-methyltransferase